MDASEMNNARKSVSLAEVLNSNPNCIPPPLNIGDKVVWLSDDGIELGIVKWLGKLPDVGNDWMAGVCFDNPVGSGTGLYNNQQLFIAPMNHASLVPVIGLIKADDFSGDKNTNTPKKPIRSKKKNDEINLSPKNVSTNSYISNKEISYDKLNKKNIDKKQANIDKNYEALSELLAQQCDTKTEKSQEKIINYQNNDYEIGSLVETIIDNQSHFGVIKWIGYLPNCDKLVAGLELEEEIPNGKDGTFGGEKYFDCAPNKSIFRLISELQKDSRFNYNNFNQPFSSSNNSNSEKNKNYDSLKNKTDDVDSHKNVVDDDGMFGSIDCPRVLGDIPPLSSISAIKNLCGKFRGIQGHHNSCYMDATLFAMFTCSTTFESLLQRPQNSNDIIEYLEVQKVLKEDIVNPLRQNFYVRADRVMKLRTLLQKLSTMRGLTSEEKDPEEFINLLLGEILKAEPYLKLSSGLESYLYQLFVEKDDQLVLPTVQQLFEQSFLASSIKLNEIPSCLILQLPRYGKQFKMYNRVIPSLSLDITDVLDNSPRQCAICGELAKLECKKCFSKFGDGLDSTAFCNDCSNKLHSISSLRSDHKVTKLNIPNEFIEFSKKKFLSYRQKSSESKAKFTMPIERVYMDLFAVLCIETSHYVCFIKCGNGKDAPWCFFDSMADRKGEQNGYNIPEVTSFPDLKWWLSEEGKNYLLTIKDDKLLPEMPRRLFCDAYMLLYQSSDTSLYK